MRALHTAYVLSRCSGTNQRHMEVNCLALLDSHLFLAHVLFLRPMCGELSKIQMIRSSARCLRSQQCFLQDLGSRSARACSSRGESGRSSSGNELCVGSTPLSWLALALLMLLLMLLLLRHSFSLLSDLGCTSCKVRCECAMRAWRRSIGASAII